MNGYRCELYKFVAYIAGTTTYAARMNPRKTFTIVDHGVDNGDPKIAAMVAQSKEIAMKPKP